MSRYPKARWRPWQYPAGAPSEHVGKPTYYRGQNRPEAVVLHVMQGYATTALEWARRGFYPKSWHYTVTHDGVVYQHLEHEHGGYHAGITDAQARQHPPTWKLWKGLGRNVNTYTIGIEHEGFAGEVLTQPAQRKASKELCQWLAQELNIPLDEDHFPPHAAIDVVNRANDFSTPARRAAWYQELREGEEMTPQEKAMLRALSDALVGPPTSESDADGDRLTKLLNEVQNEAAVFDGLRNQQRELSKHINHHPSGGTGPGTYTVSGDITLSPTEENNG